MQRPATTSMHMRPSTSTTDSFQPPVYKAIPADVRIIPTYSDGWVANTLPAIRPITPNKDLPARTMTLKDPKLGVGKTMSVSHNMHTWAPPDAPRADKPVAGWEPCQLSFLSSVKLGPGAPEPRALVPGATSPRKMSSMKVADPVEFGYMSDPRFAGTPSGMGYHASPKERSVTAMVSFRHQQPAHNSGYKSNFNSGSLAAQFRQRWPSGEDGGISVSSNSFVDKSLNDRRFPQAPVAKDPMGASAVSGYNTSLKYLGPAAAPDAISAPTAPRYGIPKEKLNAESANKFPLGKVKKMTVTVVNPSHTSGFRANFFTDGLAEQMSTRFPKDSASVSAGTFVDQNGRDRAMPGVPYNRGPAHAKHVSAYSRSLPLTPCIS